MKRDVAVPAGDGLAELWRAAVGTLGALFSGRGVALGISGRAYLAALGSAVRVHFFAYPAAAALAGAAAAPQIEAPVGVVIAGVCAALGWGVGQLINDLLDVAADRVDAPWRPGPRGLLPAGPTAAVALVLGVLVATTVAALHPRGVVLALTAIALLIVYQRAKSLPALGNVAHGAMVACAGAIGIAAAAPSQPLAPMLAQAAPTLLTIAGVAALYLQANYEKDVTGDTAAGYRTLAHVLGVRGSAALRVVATGALLLVAWRLSLLSTRASQALAGLALLSVLASAATALRHGTPRASLVGYRYAIHGTHAALLALAANTLSAIPCVALLVVGGALAERAFAASDNP